MHHAWKLYMSTNTTNWKEAALDEMAFINPSTPLTKGVTATHIAMEDLEPFSRKVRHYSKQRFNGGTKFQNKDTIVARITPSLENGKTAFVDVLQDGEVGFGSTEFIVLREKDNVSDAKYLYYLAVTPSFRDIAIKSMTGTSGRQRVQTDVVAMSRFLFPSAQEQHSIASVLSSFDDKIELLQKQNETLEQILSAMFHRFFGASGAQNKMVLSDFVDHIKTQVKPLSNPEVSFSHYSIPAFDMSRTPAYERGSTILSNKYEVVPGSILFSKLNPTTPRVWVVLTPLENAICSTEFQVLKPKKIGLLPFVYGILRFSEYARELANKTQGTSSSHRRLRPEDILGIEFPAPNDGDLARYCELALPILKKIECNENQIRHLMAMRDSLLPRLVNGELRVKK